MNVASIMTRNVLFCSARDPATVATKIMWEHDVGAVPVLDSDHRVVGIVTDRDILMAAYTRGRPVDQLEVGDVMSSPVHTVSPNDSLVKAERLMQREQIRRLPVVRDEQLVGMLSLADLSRRSKPGFIRSALSTQQVAQTLAAISAPHSGTAPLAPRG